MRLSSAAALLILFAAPLAPARADEAERLALSRALMVQLHEDDSLRASLPLLMAQLRESLVRTGQRAEDAQAYADRFQAHMSAEIGRYSDLMAEAFSQSLTEDELRAVIAFDETPAGRRFIALRPELTQASVLAMRKLEGEVAREVDDDMAADKAKAQRKM